MKLQTLIAALALTIGAASFAQTTTPVPVAQDATATPNLDKRVINQQKRIDQGTASGQLTAKETNRLDKRQAKLATDEAKAKSDGKVTRTERKKLQREANRDSQAIHKQKHDQHTAAPVGVTGH
jgi:Skp family chaperone for outer membrane proteins